MRTLILLAVLSISNALETIINPTQSQSISCGINEDCLIICNQDNACFNNTFYVYNHVVAIHCLAYQSCKKTKIFSNNVQSLSIFANDTESFVFGVLNSNTTDTDIDVRCFASRACQDATFHYFNHGNITHVCDGEKSCRASRIHSLVAIDVSCLSGDACKRLSVVLPPNKTLAQQSWITFHELMDPARITIKSLFAFRNFNCIRSCSLDHVYVIYGFEFDEYCVVSNISCMNSIESNIANMENFTIIDTYSMGYPPDLDYGSYHFTDNMLIIATFPANRNLTFIPPSMTSDSLLSILCVVCNKISLNLSSVGNVVLTAGSKAGVTVVNLVGSQHYFTFNAYDYLNWNTFHLEDTNEIIFNSLSHNSFVYLGNALDVTIDCVATDSPLYSCMEANIYSTLQVSELRIGSAGYWNIDCPLSAGCTQPLWIHFTSSEYLCPYQDYASNCSFMTFSPTFGPTVSTVNPTYSPINPTLFPTLFPTLEPTNNPTIEPTQVPSNIYVQPTTNPTRNPTMDPTTNTATKLTVHLSIGQTMETINEIKTSSFGKEYATVIWIIIIVAMCLIVMVGIVWIAYAVVKRKEAMIERAHSNLRRAVQDPGDKPPKVYPPEAVPNVQKTSELMVSGMPFPRQVSTVSEIFGSYPGRNDDKVHAPVARGYPDFVLGQECEIIGNNTAISEEDVDITAIR